MRNFIFRNSNSFAFIRQRNPQMLWKNLNFAFHTYLGITSHCSQAFSFSDKYNFSKIQNLNIFPKTCDFSTLEGGKRISSKTELRVPPTEIPQPQRLIVMGDVHGDVHAFKSALKMAGLINDEGKWSGGKTVLVQSGDVFDRGDHDLVVAELLYSLSNEASEVGGGVYCLLGNHEVMNICTDHSWAARAAFLPFDDLKPEIIEMIGTQDFEKLSGLPEWAKCRIAAMIPGAPVGKLLSRHGVSIKVGDSLIVHGGILPSHLNILGGLNGLNQRVWLWLTNQSALPQELFDNDSPIWTRFYSNPDSRELSDEAIKSLDEVLLKTGTKRMIVGHTPQQMGINHAAGGKVWRIDTAMCAMMGGKPEVLEILGNEISVITEAHKLPAAKRKARPRIANVEGKKNSNSE